VSAVTIRYFTDPACPPDPARMRLRWLYGDQVAWELCMIGVRELRGEGWPDDAGSDATIHACRAVVGTRLRWPDREDAMLRHLQVLAHAGELLDDSDTLEHAAEQAGLPVAELAEWAAAPEVEKALRADMQAARSPSPASRAQNYKLGGPSEERRYTCPSYELLRATDPPADWPTARRVDLPGFRPVEAYEAAIANLAPELVRRPKPESVADILAWAAEPLATAEVAAIAQLDATQARVKLSRVARPIPAGADFYWTAE